MILHGDFRGVSKSVGGGVLFATRQESKDTEALKIGVKTGISGREPWLLLIGRELSSPIRRIPLC